MSHLRTAHFGDPCIYCGTPHDTVAPGPCPSLVWVIANPEAAKGLAEGTRWAAPNQATREMVNEGNRHIDLYLVWSAMRKAAASTSAPSGEAQERKPTMTNVDISDVD